MLNLSPIRAKETNKGSCFSNMIDAFLLSTIWNMPNLIIGLSLFQLYFSFIIHYRFTSAETNSSATTDSIAITTATALAPIFVQINT